MVLDIKAFAHLFTQEPSKGYDIADALAAGLDQAQLQEMFRALPDSAARTSSGPEQGKAPKHLSQIDIVAQKPGVRPVVTGGFHCDEDGLFKIERSENNEEILIRIASPLYVLDRTRTEADGAG